MKTFYSFSTMTILISQDQIYDSCQAKHEEHPFGPTSKIRFILPSWIFILFPSALKDRLDTKSIRPPTNGHLKKKKRIFWQNITFLFLKKLLCLNSTFILSDTNLTLALTQNYWRHSFVPSPFLICKCAHQLVSQTVRICT